MSKQDLVSKIGLALSIIVGFVYFTLVAMDNHNELLFLSIPLTVYIFYKLESGDKNKN